MQQAVCVATQLTAQRQQGLAQSVSRLGLRARIPKQVCQDLALHMTVWLHRKISQKRFGFRTETPNTLTVFRLQTQRA